MKASDFDISIGVYPKNACSNHVRVEWIFFHIFNKKNIFSTIFGEKIFFFLTFHGNILFFPKNIHGNAEIVGISPKRLIHCYFLGTAAKNSV